MDQFTFLHAADIHLDSPLISLSFQEPEQAERIRRACRDAFENLVATAIERRVAFVILAGDLYDGDAPNMQVAVFLRHQLARLEKRGIGVFIVKGNHDAANRITSGLSLPDNTHVFGHDRPESVPVENLPVPVFVHGQSFKPGPVTDNLAAGYPSAIVGALNIGILHTSLAGAPLHDPYAPCRLEDLTTKGYDYWALGHVHKGEILSDEPWIVYPGNLQGRHVRETGPKGCVLATVTDGRIASVETLDLSVVCWQAVSLDLSAAEEEAQLLESLRRGLAEAMTGAEGRPVAVRLRLHGTTRLHDLIEGRPNRLLQTVLELAGEIASGDLWVEKIVNETRPMASGQELPGDTITDFFPMVDEVARGPAPLREALRDELASLRAKLPEELKELETFRLAEDSEAMNVALSKVKARLRARLSGEDGI